MGSFALPIFRAGQIPILGEWLALRLVALAGSRHIGEGAFNEIFHPIAVRFAGKVRGRAPSKGSLEWGR
jgi:hypothetical protein